VIGQEYLNRNIWWDNIYCVVYYLCCCLSTEIFLRFLNTAVHIRLLFLFLTVEKR